MRTYSLTQEELFRIRQLNTLIQDQQLIVESLRLSLVTYIKERCGLDVSGDEQWFLDLEEGVLRDA